MKNMVSNCLNKSFKKTVHFNPLLSGFFALIFVIVFCILQLQLSLFVATIIFCIISVLCILILLRLPRRGSDYFDPGLLFLIFTIMGTAPIGIMLLLKLPIVITGVKYSLYPKVIFLHLILITSFTFFYYLINFKRKIVISNHTPPIWHTNTWIWMAISLTLALFAIQILSDMLLTRQAGSNSEISRIFNTRIGVYGQQFLIHLGNIKGYATLFAVGTIVSRAQTLRQAYLRLTVCSLLLGIIGFGIFSSRGAALGILLSTICYVNITRWEGKFISGKIFILLMLLGVAATGILDLLESFFINGTIPNKYDIAMLFILDFGIFKNAAVVVDWVDQGIVNLHNGENYLTAIKALMPKQVRGDLPLLANWYISEVSKQQGVDYVAQGQGFGFSTVAEGYLNWRTFGVFIQGVVLAVLASVVRFVKVSKKMRFLSPFIFSTAIGVSYILIQGDTMGIMTRLKNYFLDVIFIVIVVTVIDTAIKGKRKY